MPRAEPVRSVALLLAAGLAAAPPVAARPGSDPAPARRVAISAFVAEAAQRFGIAERWIYAVMHAESAGRIGAVSSAGAMGLMQLMPGTWARQRARFGLGDDPFDPRDNILAGTSYLREMYDRYGAPGFLAAYNAGPGRYEAWRDRGRALPAETRAYVAKLAPLLRGAEQPRGSRAARPRGDWNASPLFAAPRTAQGGDAHDTAAPTVGNLFVPILRQSSP